jgi:hypothetical protein
MSAPVRPRSDDSPIELGTGINRPLVAAALGVGLLVLAAPAALYLLAGPGRAAPEVQGLTPRGAAPQRAQPIRLPVPDRPLAVIAPGSKTQAASDQLEPTPVAVELLPGKTPEPGPPPTPVAVSPVVPQPIARAAAAREPAPYYVAAEAKQTPWPFKRRFPFTEDDLRYQLNIAARDVDLETEKGATEALLKENTKALRAARASPLDIDAAAKAAKPEPALEVLANRADLKGLPVRNRAECEMSSKDVRAMREVSLEVRDARASKVSRNFGDDSARDELVAGLLRKKAEGWRDDVSVRTLAQIMQGQNRPLREEFLKTLSAAKGKAASTALAHQAVFDLTPEVREAAIAALKDRPREQYRGVLLDALRYPWAPVADRAAEALVALDDRDAALDLARLLDQPDPAAPIQDKDKKWVVAELVRMNHLANCLLCHAPGSGAKDEVRGLVPKRGRALPVVYYDSAVGDFVRAEVTYLKQDFSVLQPVSDSHPWPYLQRFDYLIRKRELSADEIARLGNPQPAAYKRASYPQRDAVLWALRQLTGEDAGDKADDWYELLWPGSCADPDL